MPEERERLRPLAEALGEEDILRMIDVVAKAEEELRKAQDPRVTLELCLLKLVQMRRLVPFQQLVDRVERLAAGVAPARGAALVAAAARCRSRVRGRASGVAVAARSRPRASASSPAAAPSLERRRARSRRSVPPPPARPRPSWPRWSRPRSLGPRCSSRCGAPSARLDGDTLALEVAADWSAFASMHEDEYRDLASRAAGRNLKLRIGAGAPASPTPVEPARLAADVRASAC